MVRRIGRNKKKNKPVEDDNSIFVSEFTELLNGILEENVQKRDAIDRFFNFKNENPNNFLQIVKKSIIVAMEAVTVGKNHQYHEILTGLCVKELLDDGFLQDPLLSVTTQQLEETAGSTVLHMNRIPDTSFCYGLLQMCCSEQLIRNCRAIYRHLTAHLISIILLALPTRINIEGNLYSILLRSIHQLLHDDNIDVLKEISKILRRFQNPKDPLCPIMTVMRQMLNDENLPDRIRIVIAPQIKMVSSSVEPLLKTLVWTEDKELKTIIYSKMGEKSILRCLRSKYLKDLLRLTSLEKDRSIRQSIYDNFLLTWIKREMNETNNHYRQESMMSQSTIDGTYHSMMEESILIERMTHIEALTKILMFLDASHETRQFLLIKRSKATNYHRILQYFFDDEKMLEMLINEIKLDEFHMMPSSLVNTTTSFIWSSLVFFIGDKQRKNYKISNEHLLERLVPSPVDLCQFIGRYVYEETKKCLKSSGELSVYPITVVVSNLLNILNYSNLIDGTYARAITELFSLLIPFLYCDFDGLFARTIIQLLYRIYGHKELFSNLMNIVNDCMSPITNVEFVKKYGRLTNQMENGETDEFEEKIFFENLNNSQNEEHEPTEREELKILLLMKEAARLFGQLKSRINSNIFVSIFHSVIEPRLQSSKRIVRQRTFSCLGSMLLANHRNITWSDQFELTSPSNRKNMIPNNLDTHEDFFDVMEKMLDDDEEREEIEEIEEGNGKEKKFSKIEIVSLKILANALATNDRTVRIYCMETLSELCVLLPYQLLRHNVMNEENLELMKRLIGTSTYIRCVIPLSTMIEFTKNFDNKNVREIHEILHSIHLFMFFHSFANNKQKMENDLNRSKGQDDSIIQRKTEIDEFSHVFLLSDWMEQCISSHLVAFLNKFDSLSSPVSSVTFHAYFEYDLVQTLIHLHQRTLIFDINFISSMIYIHIVLPDKLSFLHDLNEKFIDTYFSSNIIHQQLTSKNIEEIWATIIARLAPEEQKLDYFERFLSILQIILNPMTLRRGKKREYVLYLDYLRKKKLFYQNRVIEKIIDNFQYNQNKENDENETERLLLEKGKSLQYELIKINKEMRNDIGEYFKENTIQTHRNLKKKSTADFEETFLPSDDEDLMSTNVETIHTGEEIENLSKSISIYEERNFYGILYHIIASSTKGDYSQLIDEKFTSKLIEENENDENVIEIFNELLQYRFSVKVGEEGIVEKLEGKLEQKGRDRYQKYSNDPILHEINNFIADFYINFAKEEHPLMNFYSFLLHFAMAIMELSNKTLSTSFRSTQEEESEHFEIDDQTKNLINLFQFSQSPKKYVQLLLSEVLNGIMNNVPRYFQTNSRQMAKLIHLLNQLQNPIATTYFNPEYTKKFHVTELLRECEEIKLKCECLEELNRKSWKFINSIITSHNLPSSKKRRSRLSRTLAMERLMTEDNHLKTLASTLANSMLESDGSFLDETLITND
ncbi:hypothetical protein SNEBB_006109 [Seison nebaliae]|nr:hypothetical protein SNEBB_006109 [Seison nebaliae]